MHRRPYLAGAVCALLAPLVAGDADAGAVAADYPVHLESGQRWPPAADGAVVDASGAMAAVVLTGELEGARLGPVHIAGPYRAIETAKTAVVTNFTVDGLVATVVRECFRVRGTNITVRRTHCTELDGPRTKRGDLPEGLHIEQGSGITIEDSSFDGFQYVMPPNRYWNGDGIAAERPVTGLVIRNVSASDNTDAGFDIKPPVTMDKVAASGNCRNFRLWSDSRIGTITVGPTTYRGGRNSCAGIWIKGNDQQPPHVEIAHLIARGPADAPLILVQDGAIVIDIASCEIEGPIRRIVRLAEPGSIVHVGRGCEALAVESKPPSRSDAAQKLDPQ